MPNDRPARPAQVGLFLIIVAVPLAFMPSALAPFVDVKLALVGLSVALLSTISSSPPRRLLLAASAFVSSMVLSAGLGVDPWRSVMGSEVQGTGIAFLAVCVLGMLAAAGTPAALRSEIPRMLFWTATASGSIYLLERSGLVAAFRVSPHLDYASTLGQPVVLAGFLAAGLCAGMTLQAFRTHHWLGLGILAAALSLTANRSSAVSLAAGIAVLMLVDRRHRRTVLVRTLLVAAVLVVLATGDILVGRSAPTAGSEGLLSPARRLAEVAPASSAGQRLAVWSVALSAIQDRPLLGWGPSNTWSGLVANATASDFERGVRAYGDAHNVIAETTLTQGFVGLAALAVLFLLLGRPALSVRDADSWHAVVLAAVLAHHLFQPLNVVMTSLLFVLMGSLAATRAAEPPARRRRARTLRVAAASVVTALLLVRSGASAFEWYGDLVGSRSALVWSARLDPSRISAQRRLALDLARPGDSGDRTQDRIRARDVSDEAIRRHPWDPGVRLWSADVAILSDDPERAFLLLREHLDRFPLDTVAREGLKALAERRRADDQAAAGD